MKRADLLRLVDATAFVLVLFLLATGLVMSVVLPPGSGGLEVQGAGWRAAAQPVSLLLGLTRHEWGNVHFWLAMGFVGAIAVHVSLHAKWVIRSLFGPRAEIEPMRAIFVGGLAVVLLLVLGILFFTPVETLPRSALEEQRSAKPPIDMPIEILDLQEERGRPAK